MKTYLVGGAVRDHLLYLPVKDRDWVVVGGSADELLDLGYEQVGMGFPVFLHPISREEHALARREKKVGAGYTGFEFETTTDVTLEEDLSRRDLTINSMAIDHDGHVVDPFGGLIDLECRVLRHTSDAFGEDPLRVVRLARFYARYTRLGFTVAPETMDLARGMIARGTLNELPDERFWLELEKALGDPHPEQFFELLFQLGGLNDIDFFSRAFGGVNANRLKAIKRIAEECAGLDADLRVDVFAAALAPMSTMNFFSTARAGNIYVGLHLLLDLSGNPDAAEVTRMLTRCRAWSMNTMADDLIVALRTIESAHGIVYSLSSYVLTQCIKVGRSVTSEAYQHLEGKAIGDAMNAERARLIDIVLCLNL